MKTTKKLLFIMLIAVMLNAVAFDTCAVSVAFASVGTTVSDSMWNWFFNTAQVTTLLSDNANNNRRRRSQTGFVSATENDWQGSIFSNQPTVDSNDGFMDGVLNGQDSLWGPSVGNDSLESSPGDQKLMNPAATDGTETFNDVFPYNMSQFVPNSDYGLFY